MNNNKRFYGFFLRYTDLDTLCFRLNEGRNYKYPGMGVDILPLRGKTAFQTCSFVDKSPGSGME